MVSSVTSMGATSWVALPEITRVGATLPFRVAALSKIRMELPPWLATNRRFDVVSRNRCCGADRRVFAPLTVPDGAILPLELSALLKRRMELAVETYNCPPVAPPPPPPVLVPRRGEIWHPASNNMKARTA